MAVFYNTYRDNRETSNNFYYGRVVHLNTVNLNDIAERVQRNCSMKKSDCLAVMTEMIEVMNDELRNSNIVNIDGFGRFKLMISSKGVEQEQDYSVDCIRRAHVRFLPTGTRDASTGKTTRAWTSGITYKKSTGASTANDNGQTNP